jgi:hypothetical protein
MEKLHELSRTTMLRRRDPAHSRVLTAEKRQIRHVVSRTQVTGNPTYRELRSFGRANRVQELLPDSRLGN